MRNRELLIRFKRMYESIQDILENVEFDDFEYLNILNEQMEIIKNLYEKIWEETDLHLLKTGFHCRDCEKKLLITDVIDYEFVCTNCDENYSIDEVKVKEDVEEHWWAKNSYYGRDLNL